VHLDICSFTLVQPRHPPHSHSPFSAKSIHSIRFPKHLKRNETVPNPQIHFKINVCLNPKPAHSRHCSAGHVELGAVQNFVTVMIWDILPCTFEACAEANLHFASAALHTFVATAGRPTGRRRDAGGAPSSARPQNKLGLQLPGLHIWTTTLKS
jgi:hypothetical protein